MLDYEKQIIIGTLLGASSIITPEKCYYGYLTIVDDDVRWVEYKGYELKKYQAATPFIMSGKRMRWRTALDPIWLDFKKLHYKDDKKMVNMDLLNPLRDIGLMIWFGDKGFWFTKKIVGLRTTAYGEEGNKIICQYFNEIGIECEIKKERNTGRVVFPNNGTKNFLKLVAPILPEFMFHKLEP